MAIPARPAPSQPSSTSGRSSSAPPDDDGRFLPGALICDRYRIIGRLGRGGMGEVFRATDVRLGQTVALKFLPEAAVRDPAMLARFHGEVRIARQVTHPNVCRVYDIGEFEGQPFLSMEYVDGEDLATLLRRIGHLPVDKALEIARRLCAGLAAAHSRGVLHRDLKPANIMIDGRGQVVITDFGLAGFEEQMRGAEVRNGTPAYMAPEQLRGAGVSVRSDIYALGLVLYEVFSGRRAWEAGTLAELTRLREESRPPSLSALIRDLDPAVERVILRCLDADPAQRPPSALAVSAALPGGDPLAAALAAGETPSPEMVAASGATEGFRPAAAAACFLCVAVGALAFVLLHRNLTYAGLMDLDTPPEALAVDARKLIREFGYAGAVDRASGLEYDSAYLDYAAQHRPASGWASAANGRPAPVYFWYRESPSYLEGMNIPQAGRVTRDDPPVRLSGMVEIALDPQGRLAGFLAVPPQVDPSPPASAPPDAAPLFKAAGLDLAAFRPAAPQWTPLVSSDARAAWTGALPGNSGVPVRIEAAWWRGRPVYFQGVGPWTAPSRMRHTAWSAEQYANAITGMLLRFVLLVGGSLLAWWNLRRGRGDRQGAFRIGAFSFVATFASWALAAHHVPSPREVDLALSAVGEALWNGAQMWLAYLALEPFVRRRWPRILVSWTRLISGNWRDALVGRDFLTGTVVGVGYALMFATANILVARLGAPPAYGPDLASLSGFAPFASGLLNHVFAALSSALLFFLLFFVLRLLLRREWLAGAAFVAIFGLVRGIAADHPGVLLPTYAIVYSLVVILLLRYGLLALIACIFVTDLITSFVFTTRVGAWYGGPTAMTLLLVIALAGYSGWLAVGGRRLLALLDGAEA